MTDNATRGLCNISGASRTAIAVIVLAALCALAYSNTFGAAFHYDDNHQILDNPHIRDISNLPHFFTDSSLSSYRPDRSHYRPMTLASYAVSYALGGYDVAGWHALNLAVHILNSLLVFVLAGMVMSRVGHRDGFAARLFAAALFALHPVQTHAVTYISGRASLFAVFFCLLSLICFIRHRDGAERGWAASSAVLFLFGLFSKEIALNALALYAVYDLVYTLPGLKSRADGRGWMRAGAVYAVMLTAAGLYFALRGHAEGGARMPVWEYGMLSYWLSEAGAFLMYARLLLFPVNQNADYSIPAVTSPTAAPVAGLALAAFMLWGIYRLRRARPELALFGLWFLAGFVVESVIVPITDIAVEYRLYLPMAGGSCFVAVAGWSLINAPAVRRAAAVSVLLLFGLLTYNRNAVWATPYDLWVDVARKSPHNARAHVNFATALLDAGRYQEAVDEFSRALAMEPDDERAYKAHNNLGTCYLAMGRPDMAGAEFAEAVRLKPACAECRMNLGKVYYREGRYGEAARELAEAVRLGPGFAEARYMLAMSLRGLGRRAEALREMEAAVDAAPAGFETTYNLAVLYAENGMLDEAVARAGEALGLAADEGQRGLASALMEKLEARRGR
ncbi:MAG: tetratricopeptide repeat protein [Nitrospirae bacterium]|nr:tetratricopeptide repeat protein [Nitrospirota bacterium]